MKYNIVYDEPGRLRVRLGMYAFTKEQGYGIEELLAKKRGMQRVEASSKNGGLLILYTGRARTTALNAIRSLKRDALPVGTRTEDHQKRETRSDFVDGVIRMAAMHYAIRIFMPAPVRAALAVVRAVPFIVRGAKSLARGKLTVDVLDAASITAAFIQKDPATASSIMFLLGVSDRLESFTRKQTKNALAESLALHVDTVWLVREGEEDVRIPLADVQEGDLIRIQAGSVLPVDGTIAGGNAMINEASLTGESAPVHKDVGKSVYAGTAVQEGNVVIAVTKTASESRIANIVDMIDESELLKAGAQSRAEALADRIVPFSFLTSAVVGLATRNLTKALSVLMVDYSCALKLSIPISVISSMREAADHKILVKGGKHLECFEAADTILFDKTGTLTTASPKLEKIIAFGRYTEEKVLRDAACLEEHFPHSVARAIVCGAEEANLNHREEHTQVEYIVAHGIATKLRKKKARIGSAHFIFDDEKIPYTDEIRAAEEEMNGLSVIYLAVAGKVVGMLGIGDPIREEAPEVIRALRASGFTNIIMMTGDGEQAASRVAEQLGIDRYMSSVLPEDKAAMVEQLKAEGHTVVMVGDGINDSPALSAADVSVAMKDSSDLAKEVADITLLSDDLADLLVLQELSRRLMRRIRGNFGFIVTFNTALLALGIAGVMQAGTTSVLHNVSTMAISGASMRPYLKKVQKNENRRLTG